MAVDVLRVVIQHQQRIGVRIDHLHDQLVPVRLEVVAFVDQHGAVLGARNAAAVHAGDHRRRQRLDEGLAAARRQRLVVGHQHLAAPLVEVVDLHLLAQAALADQLFQPRGQRLVVAEHQDRLAHLACQLHRAEAEDHRLAGTGHAVDDPVLAADRPGQLFLLGVHHLDQVGNLQRPHRGIGGPEQAELAAAGFHAQFGEQVPAHAVDLRQGQRHRIHLREHRPQLLLERLGVDRLVQLVATDHQVLGQYLAQAALVELLAGDVGQHHAPAPRHDQLAGVARALRVAQRGVALQHHADLQRICARLQQRVVLLYQAALGDQGELGAVGVADGVGLPVLHFQHQQAAARVEHHEVRMALLEPDRHVVPEQVVVLQLLFQPFGDTLLAAGHARQAAVAGWDECCHRRPWLTSPGDVSR